jgi:ubiquinone/menaquinone biosynthesis C-methylase UbiE
MVKGYLLSNTDLTGNIERFTGFADCYDAYRPTPPSVIADILTQLAQSSKPGLVVDLGSGTGLSTRIWANHAYGVIGVEPSADMRLEAEKRTDELCPNSNISYREGLSSKTGLPDRCVDIVTCSQSLHWMEPGSTFAEAARILRPGGIFAAIDCDWPPVMNWEAELAYKEFNKRVHELEEAYGIEKRISRWSKDEHLARIRESGQFRYTREILVHSVETGNAKRLIGLALSFGSIQDLLKRGTSEKEIGLDDLKGAAERTLGDEPSTWYFCYRIRIGVK